RAFLFEDKQELFERALELANHEAASREPDARKGTPAAARAALLWSERSHMPRLRDLWSRDHATPGAPLALEADLELAISRAREDLHWLDDRIHSSRTIAQALSPAARRRGDRWRRR